MFVTQPHIILIIDTFILPTAWKIFSNAMPTFTIVENENAIVEYITARLITSVSVVNIFTKYGIPNIEKTVSISPCIKLRNNP